MVTIPRAMIKCSTGKRIYFTLAQAEDALLDARATYSYSKGQGPVAIYQCDECGQFHLTSRGPVNEKLNRHILDGKLKLETEARKWESKLKKK